MKISTVLIALASYIIYNKETYKNIEINKELSNIYEVKQDIIKINNSVSTDKINEVCKTVINGKVTGSLCNIYAYSVLKVYDYVKSY
jgi:hypothetical protein